MAKQKWDGTLDKELTINFILYLWEGFKKYGHDKNADNIFYYGVRKITEAIGLSKKQKISKVALKNKSNQNIKEHKIPAIIFYQEFRDKKTNNKEFTKADAEKWLDQAEYVTISKEEDDMLTARGWRDKKRPRDAYEKLDPPIELVEQYEQKHLKITTVRISGNKESRQYSLDEIINYIENKDVRENLIIFKEKIASLSNKIYFETKGNECDFGLYINNDRIIKFICRKGIYKLVIRKDKELIPDSPKHILKDDKYYLYDNIYELSDEEMEKFIKFIEVNYI